MNEVIDYLVDLHYVAQNKGIDVDYVILYNERQDKALNCVNEYIEMGK